MGITGPRCGGGGQLNVAASLADFRDSPWGPVCMTDGAISFSNPFFNGTAGIRDELAPVQWKAAHRAHPKREYGDVADFGYRL